MLMKGGHGSGGVDGVVAVVVVVAEEEEDAMVNERLGLWTLSGVLDPWNVTLYVIYCCRNERRIL